MKYDLIIFDCDGTLVNSESLGLKAISSVLVGLGYKEYTYDKCAQEFAGVPDSIVLLKLKAKHKDLDVAKVDHEYAKKMKSMVMNDLEPVTGAHDLLNKLGSVRKCIASNGDYKDVKAVLDATKLSQYFKDEHIFTYDKIGKAKPDPTMFLHAAEVYEVSPRKCLVIEDSFSGIKAANEAKMDVIRVENGHMHIDTNLLLKTIGSVKNLIDVMDYI